MLPSSIRNHLLVDEGQLGQRLNRDLQHGDRADFRLHLALLTDAVEEQPWFDAKPAASPQSRDWRLHFDLRPAEVLVAEGAGSDCSAINERLQQGGSMVDVRLWLALQTPPLAVKQPLLDEAVYDNLSPLARERLQGKLADMPRQEDPLVLLPVLDRLQQGVDTRLHWLS
ncbi:VC2046/SO_2500 family protein [Aeromonas allosaccharophila]|uniref:VC2046/SO_2500 family protein n=1 Tax=Aeromonas allosaccharophila TaxID=656 RepID=UPI0039869A0C